MELKLKTISFRLCLNILFMFSWFHIGRTENATASSYRHGSVKCKNRQCVFYPNVLAWRTATAVGSFNDTLLTTGWGILDISAGFARRRYSSMDIMYAAGYLEGVFTARQMEAHYTNIKHVLLPGHGEMEKKLEQWFIKQRQWTDMMVASHRATNPVWRHVDYMLSQFDGLLAGYRSVSGGDDAPLDEFALSFMNGMGDILDLLKVLKLHTLPDWTKFTKEEAEELFYSSAHCSALIKVLPGLENLFMSHSSWFVYQISNRIYKHYNLNINDKNTAAKKLSFASYPGFLESMDDFYILGSGMVMLQTTIDVFNYTLYNKVTPESLFAWQRVRVANMLAHSGEEWAQIYKKYNSGTYNNEYMIIDLKKFTPNQPIPDGLLWVVDQMPGMVVARDTTDILRAGYFSSYNVPFFEEIYDYSGQAAFAAHFGLDYTHDLAPRAKIFRRDQSKVTDLQTMKDLMRYDNYKHDPYGKGNWRGAICARGDMDWSRPSSDGCYDTKVSDYAMAKRFQSDIISGPTLNNNYPPFSWTGPYVNLSHVGLPHTYDFPFIRAQPRFT